MNNNPDFNIGEYYDVKVKKILDKGIIVEDIKRPEITAFIHLSKIADRYIDDIHKYMSVGDIFNVECVESSVKPVELSMIHLNLSPHSISNDKNKYNISKSNDSLDKSVQNPVDKKPDIESMIRNMNKTFEDKYSDISSRNRRKRNR